MPHTLNVNGESTTFDAPDDMPLLWVLRDVGGLTGTKLGCGMGLCGACTVHLDGQAIRSCITPISAVVGKRVTTIEGVGSEATDKAVQDAWCELNVPQCGYCQPGQIMSATALLRTNAKPTDGDLAIIPASQPPALLQTATTLGAYIHTRHSTSEASRAARS